MDVAVINFEARNNQSCSFTAESSFLSIADVGRDEKKVLRKIFRKICPLIDLLNRNNQCVSSGDGIDGHEHHTEIIAISESCRYISIDDFGKKCWHGATISCSDDGLWRRNRD